MLNPETMVRASEDEAEDDERRARPASARDGTTTTKEKQKTVESSQVQRTGSQSRGRDGAH